MISSCTFQWKNIKILMNEKEPILNNMLHLCENDNKQENTDTIVYATIRFWKCL